MKQGETIFLIACSVKGYELACRLREELRRDPRNDSRQVECKVKCRSLPGLSEERPLTECVGEWFGRADALVFFCAVGIAVRSIAPYLGHKSKDPAVVAVDEAGRFSVSLLSGHHGGANRLAEEIANLLGAQAVITTATDREGKFAVDVFAQKNGLVVTDWELAKQVSVELLEGRSVGFCTGPAVRISGDRLPDGLVLETEDGDGRKEGLQILISNRAPGDRSSRRPEGRIRERILQLVPANIYLGIGCRKGADVQSIEQAVTKALCQAGVLPQAAAGVASIDRKAQEPGLVAFCEAWGLPFQNYTAEELRLVQGSESSSRFVEQVTGVDNVCERSALAVSGGRLLAGKLVCGGVTVAVAEREIELQL